MDPARDRDLIRRPETRDCCDFGCRCHIRVTSNDETVREWEARARELPRWNSCTRFVVVNDLRQGTSGIRYEMSLTSRIDRHGQLADCLVAVVS